MFDINEKTQTGGTGPVPKVGLQEIVLKAVEYRKLKDDAPAPVIIFDFVTEDGASVNKVIFPPNKERAIEKASQGEIATYSDEEAGIVKGRPYTAEGLFRRDALNVSRTVKHLLTGFMDASEILIPATSFAELAQGIRTLVTSKEVIGRKAWALMVYDKRGYVGFKAYPPMIAHISVAKEATGLVPGKGESLEAPKKTPTNELASGPAVPGALPVSGENLNDDLPF